MKTNVNELSGAALDWAVITVTEAWKDAHKFFPTMTLDPTFVGVEVRFLSTGEGVCWLVPNNPFRQDHRIFTPSTYWEYAGPLIESFNIWLSPPVEDAEEPYGWDAEIYSSDGNSSTLIVACETPLIAACRAVVAFAVGDTIDIPDELGGGQ